MYFLIHSTLFEYEKYLFNYFNVVTVFQYIVECRFGNLINREREGKREWERTRGVIERMSVIVQFLCEKETVRTRQNRMAGIYLCIADISQFISLSQIGFKTDTIFILSFLLFWILFGSLCKINCYEKLQTFNRQILLSFGFKWKSKNVRFRKSETKPNTKNNVHSCLFYCRVMTVWSEKPLNTSRTARYFVCL